MRFLASGFFHKSVCIMALNSPFKCLQKFANIFKSKPFKEPWNRFPAWQAGTTTLLVVPHARLHRLAESIAGQHTRLLIRAQKPALEREIDSASLCSLAGGTANRVVVLARQAGTQFLGFLNDLKIRALDRFLKTNISFMSPLHVLYTHSYTSPLKSVSNIQHYKFTVQR
jgi:hypothetical protein